MRRPVLFPESIWGPDLAATTDIGREVAIAARARYEKHGGVLEADLRSCADPGPDGTRLPKCVARKVCCSSRSELPTIPRALVSRRSTS